MLYGYLARKDSRVIISVLTNVTSVSDNAMSGNGRTISNYNDPGSEVFAIVSDLTLAEGDVLPADAVDKSSELVSDNASLKEELTEANRKIASLEADNMATLMAITALFELLPVPVIEPEEAPQASGGSAESST